MAVVGSAKPSMRNDRESFKDGRESIYLTWLVETDSPNDTVVTALSAPGLPAVGAVLAGTALSMTGREAKRLTDKTLWFEVVCEYTLPQRGTSGSAQFWIPPLQRPPVHRWPGWSESGPYFIDSTDVKVVNTVGDRFDPMAQRMYFGSTLVIVRNEWPYRELDKNSYRGTLNSAAVTIFGETYGAETLLMMSITAEEVTETSPLDGSQWKYAQVTYEMGYDPG